MSFQALAKDCFCFLTEKCIISNEGASEHTRFVDLGLTWSNMISSHPIFEIKCKRTVGMSGIIKAPFHPLILCPTAFFLDVCNRHIIYLSWGQGELLRGISKPSRRSKFPKVNQVSLQIQHKNCSFSNRSTRAAHAGKHPQTWLQKTARSDIPQAVLGETECKLITQDVLWWSKINPLADSFSLCSQSHQKHINDAPSLGLGLGSDKPSVFLFLFVIFFFSPDVICAYRNWSAMRLPKGSYFAERFTACLTLRDADIVLCAGVWAISQPRPPFYRALNKRLAGFSSSSIEDFSSRV